MSKISFQTFCIEYYSHYTQKPSNEVFQIFEREGILELLDEDYDDLHGMGMEYLMQFFDDYLSGVKK